MTTPKEEAAQAAAGGGRKKDPSDGRGWSSEEASSSETSEDEYMVINFSIPGEAAGSVIGTGRSTLKLIRERTGCQHIEVRGKRMDTHREVRVTIKNMAEGSRARKAVKRLVKAHKAGEWCVRDETMKLIHNDGWGATTPKDPKEAKELDRSRAAHTR